MESEIGNLRHSSLPVSSNSLLHQLQIHSILGCDLSPLLETLDCTRQWEFLCCGCQMAMRILGM